ncbi:MAG: AAA family ATPase [Halobacteriales archaeon]
MRVVGVVGMPASGKSEAARLARDEGVPVVTMGDVIRDEVERRGLEPTDENMGSVATALREEEGDDAVARRCIEEIRAKSAPVVVVDGLRSDDEADYFRDEFGDGFVLVAVEAPFETRLERVRARDRDDDMATGNELRERDERELGYGMGDAIEDADVRIDNDGSLDEFREKFRAVLTDESQ